MARVSYVRQKWHMPRFPQAKAHKMLVNKCTWGTFLYQRVSQPKYGALMKAIPRQLKSWIIVLLGAWVALSAAARAADLAPMPPKAGISPALTLNPWTFSVTPYGWLPLLHGSTTVKGRTADVNVDFNDLTSLVRDSEIPKDL